MYAPQKAEEKNELWANLLQAEACSEALWCLMGDFNIVRGVEERTGSVFNPRKADDFNTFINRTASGTKLRG